MTTSTDNPQIVSSFGYESWMLQVPELRAVMDQALAQGWDASTPVGQNKIRGALEATGWWKTHTQAQMDWQQFAANNPAEVDPNNPASMVAQEALNIRLQASQLGVTVDPNRLQQLAVDSLQNKWKPDVLRDAISREVQYAPGAPGAGNAGSVIDQLKTQAADYFVSLDPATMQSWAQNIVSGAANQATFDSYLKDQAKGKFIGLAPYLDQGMTPKQVVEPLRQDLARTLEIAPDTVDFLNNPKFLHVLDYVPPGETQHRLMTSSEAMTYARGLPEYSYTKGARDGVAQMATSVLKDFGAVA